MGVLIDEGDLHGAAGVRAGEVLAGRYRVDKVLGVGGMGVVVAAHHVQLDTQVAIKFLLPSMLNKPEAVMRFAREARAASRITSEHVARVFDVGTLENGAPYMVMEHLDGGDLSTWLLERGPLPTELAVEFVLQACVAVADAHGLGIIHRDIKPANLFCVRRSDGQFLIKVLDFGISKLSDLGPAGAVGSATQTSALMGSPHYMSPEQMRSSRDVDARTDIWALGVVLYELLTAKTPFSGETFAEILIHLATLPPPPLREARPDVPEVLERVILKCLEKDRADRHANVADLALALLPFGPRRARASVDRIAGIIRGAGLSASIAPPPSSLGSPPSPAEASPPQTAATWAKPPGVSSSRRTALGAAASLGVLVVAAGLALVWQSRTEAAPGAASPGTTDLRLPATSRATSPSTGPSLDPNPTASPAAPASPSARPGAPIGTSDAGRSEAVVASPPVVPVPAPSRPAPRDRSARPLPSAPTRPSDPPSCTVPFFFDAAGNRVFKKECL